MLRGLATQLLRHKRIKTTEAKAKEMRRFAEAIITRAKRAVLAEQDGGAVNVHARRVVARDVNDPAVVHELFSEIVQKVAHRPGGYTRVVKTRQRLGDGARLAILELVDYNMERDENAVRNRSKSTMSRAERVARSKAKAAKSADAPAADAPSTKKSKAKSAEAEAVMPTPEADVAPVEEITPTAEATAAPPDADVRSFDGTDDEPPADGEPTSAS